MEETILQVDMDLKWKFSFDEQVISNSMILFSA